MRGVSIRIFIVDDHPLIRCGLEKMISREPDFVVCGEAATAEEALEAISKNPPEVAVIDISLGDANGLDLTKSLTKKFPSIKVLILSIHDEDTYAELALRAGARGFLSKVEAPEKIILALREIINGHIHVSPGMKNTLLMKVARPETRTTGTPIDLLTDRELEVFRMLGNGYRSNMIAEKLLVNVRTIDSHREHIKKKLGIKTAPELIKQAVQFVMNPQKRSRGGHGSK
jgi:DNA-binding NarL/FixJ family response regulator